MNVGRLLELNTCLLYQIMIKRISEGLSGEGYKRIMGAGFSVLKHYNNIFKITIMGGSIPKYKVNK